MKEFIVSILIILFAMPFAMRSADFEARENDSRLYTKFVGQLAKKNLSDLVALEWQGMSAYSDKENPYVRDHLIGQFIPSVLMAKIGWDWKFSHYIVNQIYRFLIPWLLFLFCSKFFDSKVSLLILFCSHLNLMGLNYGLRANQEQALMFTISLSLWGFVSLKDSFGKVGFYLSGVFGFLIKGFAGLIHFPYWVLYCFFVSNSRNRDLVKLVLMGFLLILTATIYEFWFKSVTGYSFWEGYIDIQILGRGKSGSTPFSSIFYYLSRALGYSLPWAFGCFLLKLKSFKREQKEAIFLMAILSLGMIITFGFFGRRASRYIYPAYYLISIIGAIGLGKYFDWFLNNKLRFFENISMARIHCFLYWLVFIAQFGVYLYKGKTYVI